MAKYDLNCPNQIGFNLIKSKRLKSRDLSTTVLLNNKRLFSIGSFEMYYHHLLVIAVLSLAVSMSAMVRSYPLEYGYELNEFDPFFNYKGTKYLVENGWFAYKDWYDETAWYPTGIDISASAQEMLHYTGAALYNIFGGDMPLYDFLIPLPLIFGSLTAISVFAMVRVVGGTSAGMLASMFFAISVPIINRGTIGWFKSEPIGLFYGVIALYFLLSGLESKNRKMAIIKLVLGGMFMSFGLSAWGGVQFFIIPVGIFFLLIPFIRKNLNFHVWAIPLFVGSLFAFMSLFEKGGLREITGVVGLAVAAPTIFVVVCYFLQKKWPKNYMRNIIMLIAGVTGAGISFAILNSIFIFISIPFRYLTAINPFLKSQSVISQSVAEHATTTIQQSFSFFSVLLIFAGIGAWLLLTNREKIESYLPKISFDMAIFSLVLAITGTYVSSAFIRLELFTTFSVSTLASIAIMIVASEFFKPSTQSKKRVDMPKIAKFGFVAIIVVLLITPTLTPVYGNWTNSSRGPPTLLNGGTSWGVNYNDWPEAMEWIKNNTPKDAVVGSWWDYGYWITVLSERISLADNGTVSTKQIAKIGGIMMSNPDDAWRSLNEWGVDYFLIFIAAQKLQGSPPLYFLNGGGDESKKVWFIRISGNELRDFTYSDGFSGTDYFWNDTLLGHMIPYSVTTYYNQQTQEQSPTYRTGYTGIYHKDIKYPSTGDGPLKLAYASNSFVEDRDVQTAILLYEVNKDYVPADVPTGEPNTARVTTGIGQFVIELDRDSAPNTVENFVNLTKTGLYDNTIFHRIIPNYIIQGGDPNTKFYGRDTWGYGGPDYSIDTEYNDLRHTKYAISMAKTNEENSAGSQFFIMLGDSPQLDGQYTVFGRVTEGQNVIDMLGALNTTENEQPVQAYDAMIEKIEILR